MTLDPTAQMELQMFEGWLGTATTEQIGERVKKLHDEFRKRLGRNYGKATVQAALPGKWECLSAALQALGMRKTRGR